MATKSAAAIGSATWISTEKENVVQLLEQEKEEMIFPVQHEMEWLNEHMAEIFSRSHVDVANIFKTPGKLRGKTPRTTRKKNVAETRIPLSDVFSSEPISMRSPPKDKTVKLAPHFVVATDISENKHNISRSQVDSGYHGSSQDPMELDVTLDGMMDEIAPAAVVPEPIHQVMEQIKGARSQDVRTTEGSFHSAKEDQTTKLVVADNQHSSKGETVKDEEAFDAPVPTVEQSPAEVEMQDEFEEIGSPSDESTPDRPLVRKSSLTFASLPAREPLNKSIGNRVSRTSHIEQNKSHLPNRTSQTSYPAQSIDHHDSDVDDDADIDNSNIEILGHDDSDDERQEMKNLSKSSTQRLHEKINMLGKAPAPRPSKSIPSALAIAARQSGAPTTDGKDLQHTPEDDDDWIKPLNSPLQEQYASNTKSQEINTKTESEDEGEFDLRAPELIAHEERVRTPARVSPGPNKMLSGYGHAKAASTATLASPAKATMAPPASPAKSISATYPGRSTTTPQGSPRRLLGGPLSASKMKLQSIMKTAKGLFTSSAGVSAAAKLETLSPRALQMATSTMPGMYPNLGNLLEDKPLPASPGKEIRKTRSSTEREKEEKRKEKEVKAMQKMDEQLEKAREKEKQKAAQQKTVQDKVVASKEIQQTSRTSPRRTPDDRPEQDLSDVYILGGQPSGMKGPRPVRPGRDAAPKHKPAPVSIRVGTLSQRMPVNPASIHSSNQDTLQGEPKRPGLTKKTSNASIHLANAPAFKSSVASQPAKPKALLAAERKREQEEREAQRKLEQKKELERKRAVQQEEARKQEQKQRAEAERKERERLAAEQAKRQVQQQAIERKRQETAKKAEQQRTERAESEAARPPSRLGAQSAGRSLINHPLPTNPAKPAKRPLEEESTTNRPQAPKFGAASQQTDSKRRKTEDENQIEQLPRPTMSGAPIRQSNLGKKPSIFSHNNYVPAPPPSHLTSFPQPPNRAQPPQMSQFATSKIPFADAPNPPAALTHHAVTKTPVSAFSAHKTIQTVQSVKSSPHYQNGEAIHLPEIPTDSEDEDSDDDNAANAFPIPDWATPGHLTDQLIRQEGMDGDAVFGPIAPLKMEEIFAKGNKDRLKRLRDRTSSANWTMSGDGLTVEEVKADRELRERMRIEGGWRYGN